MDVAESISVPVQLDVNTELVSRVSASGKRSQKQTLLLHCISNSTAILRGYWTHWRIAEKPGMSVTVVMVAFAPTAVRATRRRKARIVLWR